MTGRRTHTRPRLRVAAACTAVAVAAVTGCAVTTGPLTEGAAASPAPAAAPATLTLPAPTGRYPVGRTDLQLVDRSRTNPWVGGTRRLMISLWYPTVPGDHHPTAPVMQPAAAAHFGTTDAVQDYGVPKGTVDWAATRTHAHLGAPVRAGRWPTVLYSPGLGDPRTWDTALVEDLASRGYLVVTVDHPYEASEVEFPDGHVADNSVLLKRFADTKDPIGLLEQILAVRVADSEFVLRTLLSPTRPWSRSVDTREIGMFGHSGGGFEAFELMREDPRVTAGVDLDGIVGYDESDQGPGLSPLATHGLGRPFLLAGSSTNDHYTSTSWASLWRHSTGWRRDLHFAGTEHSSFTDAESYLPQIADRLPAGTLTDQIGWADPAATVRAERTYLAAFFDRSLRQRPTTLFDPARPDPDPAVTIVR